MAALNMTTQTHVRQLGISKPQFNLGRLFARLNGTEDIDPIAQQRQNMATDGRIALSEGFNRAQYRA